MAMLTDRDLMARLIAFDSVSAKSNVPIADFVADYLETAGCRIWRHAYEDGQKVDLLAWRVPSVETAAEKGRGLLLSGHLDVVPASEPDWRNDPFALTERDGRLLGRGTADMKGWVALAVNQLATRRDVELATPLVLLLTADEEVGSIGAQRFVAAWREWESKPFALPRACLVGEPTGLRVVRMHKGHLKARVIAVGRPAHSGYPHLGVNAIEIGGAALAELTRLARELRGERAPTSLHFPECPYPVLNVGLIAGGSAVNVVPERCAIDFGVRPLPGQNSSEIVRRIEKRIHGVPTNSPGQLRFELINDSPPLLCDEDAPLHAELCRMMGQPQTCSVSYASDAGWLSTLGLDCVLFGPGNIEDAHRANESIDIAEWQAGGRWLGEAARRLCGRG